MKRLVILLTVIAAIILTVGVTSYARTAVQTAQQPKPVKVLSKYETGKPDAQEMLELVNKERAKVGVAPLKVQTNLVKSAQYKADDFVSRDYYSHFDPVTGKKNGLDYLDKIDDTCSYIGENINNNLVDSKSSVESWMNSPAHKKAILDSRYSYTGFGVSQKGDYYFAVEHFCIAK